MPAHSSARFGVSWVGQRGLFRIHLRQQFNTDWLGRVVEAVSGQSLDAYLAEHILGLLGMNSTVFSPADQQRVRIVPVHSKDEDGNWVTTDFDWDQRPSY
jgi:methyl acetate hydrolase